VKGSFNDKEGPQVVRKLKKLEFCDQ
jgi:hypothetical protein